MLYIHILTGTAALVIGPFQFLKLSQKKIRLHRKLGKIYVAAIFLNHGPSRVDVSQLRRYMGIRYFSH